MTGGHFGGLFSKKPAAFFKKAGGFFKKSRRLFLDTD
jgi:hypothetical protein